MMKIGFTVTLLAVTIFALFSSSSSVFVSAASVRREWGLLDPQNTNINYHYIIYKESSSSSWKTVSSMSLLGARDKIYLCGLVGYQGNQVTAATASGSIPPGYPLGMRINGCSGYSNTNEVVHSFEDQCTTASVVSDTNALRLNCTGMRTGGMYGTPSPAGSRYIRVDYTRKFFFRYAFSTTWKPLCDDSMYSTTSTMAGLCTAIDGGKVQRSGSWFTGYVSSSSEFAGRGLSCSSSAKNFSQCSFSSTTSYCYTSEALSINCDQWDSNPISSGGYEIRRDPSNRNMLIEIRSQTSSSSSYGTICDDGFSTSSATFFCSLLGFPTSAASYSSSSTGTSSYTSLILKNVQCSSWVTSLSSCSKTTSFSDCSRSESVYVVCPDPISQSGTDPVRSGTIDLRLLTETPLNQLQVRSSSSSPWQLVCDDYFSYETASRIGKYLGKGDYCSWTSSSGKTGQTFGYSNVKCYHNSGTLSECAKTTSHHCSLSEAVSISKCWNYSTGVILGSYALRISNDGDNRLEVRGSEDSTWGGIAYSTQATYSTNERSLCQMLGFGTSGAYAGRASKKSARVVMKNLYCSSVKTNLASCTFTTAGSDDQPSSTTFLSLSCGTMNTPSNSNNNDDDDDENDVAVLIPAIVGGVFGGIIFLVVMIVVCVNACGESDTSSSFSPSSTNKLQLSVNNRSNLNNTTTSSWNASPSSTTNNLNHSSMVIAGQPTAGMTMSGNNANNFEMNNYPTSNNNTMSYPPAPPAPPGGWGTSPSPQTNMSMAPPPPPPAPGNGDMAWGVPPQSWNQQQMNFIPGYGQNFAPAQPPPPPQQYSSGYPG